MITDVQRQTQKHPQRLCAVPAVTNGDQILYDGDDDVKDQACWSPWMTSLLSKC